MLQPQLEQVQQELQQQQMMLLHFWEDDLASLLPVHWARQQEEQPAQLRQEQVAAQRCSWEDGQASSVSRMGVRPLKYQHR